MRLSRSLKRMAKGLVLHYLRGGTVEQAERLGEKGGIPRELLQFLPAMMFQATSAAAVVSLGEKTLTQVVEILAARGAPRDDAKILVELALGFMRDLTATLANDGPVPQANRPWYEYE